MAASTATAPELTAEQVVKILVEPLQAASVFLAAGPRIFDTNGSPVRVPKLNGMTEPSWIGENTLIPEVEADFGEVMLLPSGMRSVKSLTRFSNELARQSVISLDAALRDRMVRDVATKLDNAFIAGTGGAPAGTEPLGLVNYPGTQQITGIGDLSLDDLHDAEGLALGANVDPARLKWFMRSNVFVGLRKLKDADGRYLIQPDPTEAGAYRLLGHGVTVTNRLPVNTTPDPDTTSVVLADFSQIAVARDLAPSVKILDQTFGDFDQMAIRVVARYDAAPLNPEGVIVLRGVTA